MNSDSTIGDTLGEDWVDETPFAVMTLFAILIISVFKLFLANLYYTLFRVIDINIKKTADKKSVIILQRSLFLLCFLLMFIYLMI